MKKSVIIFLLFVSHLNFAQNTFPNNGNVGIGTTTPTGKLDVTGSYAEVSLNANATASANFRTAGHVQMAINTSVTYPYTTSLQSKHSTADGESYPIALNPLGGNVGIGTTSPSARLEIIGSTSNVNGYVDGHVQVVGQDPIAFIGQSNLNPSLNRWGIRLREIGDGDFSIRDNTNNLTRLLIKSTGNVGIGTTNPSGKLEITGDSGVYSDFASYSGTTINNYLPNGKEPTLVISEKLGGTFTPAVGDQVTYRGGLSFGKGGPGIYSINPNPAGSPFYGEIRFHTTYWNGSNYNNSDRMVIKLDGNVGIGTITPDSKLAVNGTIHSKEVKVDMTGWSDFVFKKEYSLPTLEEVEKQITEKGHLENIPSEEEVLKNGINLGEMNAKLLQKIEEMTLYVIEQQKKNSLQSAEIESLKKENQNFKVIFERLAKIESQIK